MDSLFCIKCGRFLQCYEDEISLLLKYFGYVFDMSKERSGIRVTPRSFAVLFETTVQPSRLIVRMFSSHRYNNIIASLHSFNSAHMNSHRQGRNASHLLGRHLTLMGPQLSDPTTVHRKSIQV